MNMALLGKDYFRPLDFDLTVSGLLKMMLSARVDALDFNLIQDMVDYLFMNYTRPARIRDLALYMLLIFIPFFIQVCLPNDPTADDYDETTAATLIRVFCAIILVGQVFNLVGEYQTLKSHLDYESSWLAGFRSHFGLQNFIDLITILF